jgi:hypothetical protein
MPIPIGRVSRERLARHIVELIEKPQRALFISRVYEFPVLLNKLFPAVVDRISAMWVRNRRKKELPSPEEITRVQYQSPRPAIPLMLAAGSIGMLAILLRFARRRQR